MIIGGLFVLFGLVAPFDDQEGIFNDLWIGSLFLFLGLLIFFIARIRKQSIPVSKAKLLEARIGKFLGIIAGIMAIIIVIVGAITNTAENYQLGTGIFVGILIIAEGAGIWWVTRIRKKQTP